MLLLDYLLKEKGGSDLEEELNFYSPWFSTLNSRTLKMCSHGNTVLSS